MTQNTKTLNRRRGTTTVMLALVLTVVLGAVAMTIDINHINNIHSELQTAADTAVLGGVQYLPDGNRCRQIGFQIAHLNHANRGIVVRPGDLVLGNWSDARVFTPGAAPINAMRAVTRRAETNENPVPLTFASIFGYDQADVTAFAIAKRDTRFGGIDPKKPCADILPLSVDIDDYNEMLLLGNDDFAYGNQTGAVTAGPDGIPEIIAYPDELAPGNFGLLNIGTPNMSTPALSGQIDGGVSSDNLMTEIGTDVLLFYDDDGARLTYEITGNPGLKAALEQDFASRVGDIVAIFVHDSIVEGGSNAVYNIIGLRFGRIMEAVLQDGTVNRGIWFQPVDYECDAIIINPNVPPDPTIGKVELVR